MPSTEQPAKPIVVLPMQGYWLARRVDGMSSGRGSTAEAALVDFIAPWGIDLGQLEEIVPPPADAPQGAKFFRLRAG